MKIIIVGCGKVGETLAGALNKESHEVFIIDKQAGVVEDICDRLDILGACGSGVSADVLRDAGVAKADLLIAVTEEDEVNLLCCLIAKKLGVKSTIARVRNPEYSGEISLIQEDLGLSMVINPESAAAMEIAQLIRFPSAVDVDTFARGRVEIFKLNVTAESPLDGLKICDLYPKTKLKVLVCVVERDGDAFIPRGDFILAAGDRISVISPENEISKFFRFADCISGRINSAMIVGGGKISYYLGKLLSEDGIAVKMVENNMERCEELSEALPKVTVLDGSGDEHKLMVDEGLATVGAFASLTDMDEENMLLSMFAQSKSKAKIITKINRPELCEIADDINLGSVISPRLITAENILRFVRTMQNSYGSNVENLYNLVEDKVEALEFKVREQVSFLGVPLMELKLKKGLIVACLSRKGKVIIPGGRDTVELGDRVIIVTTNKGLDDIRDILAD